MTLWSLGDLFDADKTFFLIEFSLALGFALVILLIHLNLGMPARFLLVLVANLAVFLGVILYDPSLGGSFVFFPLTCFPWLIFGQSNAHDFRGSSFRWERVGFWLSAALPPLLFVLGESPLRQELFPPPIFPPDRWYFWGNAACAFIPCYLSYSFFARANRESSEEKLQKIADSNLIGIAIGRPDGTIHHANQVLLSMLGYTTADLKAGRFNLVELTPSEYRERTRQAFDEASRLGRSAYFEKEYLHRNGRRVPVLLAVSKLDADTGEFIASFLDLSERRDLAEKASELEKSRQIIHAWNEFTTIAAHELKTPISVLSLQYQMFTRFLEKPAGTANPSFDDANLRSIVRHGQHSTHRLNQLVNQLLDFTLIRAGKLILTRTHTDLNLCLKQIVEELESSQLITPGMIELTCPSTSLQGFVDRLRIGQIMTNLITNAVKYGRQKSIKITLESGDIPSWARIRVSDQGVGISPADQERIFGRFERTNEARRAASGLGLGLYIVQNLVEAHEGKVFVKSAPDQGSEFTVELPLRMTQQPVYPLAQLQASTP